MRPTSRTLCMISAFLILGVSTSLAQGFRCDWSVNGIAGGTMSSPAYRSDATAGQTAISALTGTNYNAFIGFWQIDTALVGVQEEASWSLLDPLTTRLFAPFPNPSRGDVQIHYSLAAKSQVVLALYDLSGRTVATLVQTTQSPGRYTCHLSPAACGLSAGIYFLKLKAGEFSVTRKLILQ